MEVPRAAKSANEAKVADPDELAAENGDSRDSSSNLCDSDAGEVMAGFIVLDETSSTSVQNENVPEIKTNEVLNNTVNSTKVDSCVIDDLFILDSTPSAENDESGNRRSLGPRYRRDCDGVLTEKSEVPEDSEESDSCPKGEGRCFNCLGDHLMSDCPKPRDEAAIFRNRRNFFANQPKLNRYHTDDSQKFGNFTPGVLSSELREALGLEKDQLPLHIYRMRTLGYPPGWLEELKIYSSGLSLLDSASEEPDCENINFKYDVEGIIEYPGFNAPPEPNIRDESYYMGFPPMFRDHCKESMANHLSHLNNLRLSHKRHFDDNSNEFSRSKKIRHEEATETDNEQVDMELSSDVSLEDLESQRLALLAELENEGPLLAKTDGDTPQSPPLVEADEEATPQSTRLIEKDEGTPKATRLVQLGTPVGARFSSYGSLPSLDKFSEGMGEISYEETTPTGMFDRVKQILKRVQQTLTRKK